MGRAGKQRIVRAAVDFAPSRTPHRQRSTRAALLASVSMAALLLASGALAKDLGGRASSGPSEAAIAASRNAQAQAAAAAQRSQNALRRATQAIQAVQSSQQAVRDWARSQLRSGIPDGLNQGGLQVAPGATPGSDQWVGANAPGSITTGDHTQVIIEQTQQKSILTWETFNLSENTSLKYDQKGNRDWISLNRVLDPSARPSRILGSITADGTVLVINKNGIIFGAGAQINVGSLMASTLDVGPAFLPDPTSSAGTMISTTIAMRNQNFLANGLDGYKTDKTAGDGNLASATFSALDGSNDGTVTVEEGAQITTTPGGLILLAAPHVINAGRLTAAQGQVILTAAETALTLTTSEGTGTDPIRGGQGGDTNPQYVWAAPDKDVRGFVPLPQGKRERSDYFVWNTATGLIEAPQGNIYLRSPGNKAGPSLPDNGGGITLGFGAAYNDGILSATTSVSRNGSIIIDAGDVRLGKGSLLSILVDASDEKIPQSPESLDGFRPSAIKIGRNADRIVMEEDALLIAPAAKVEIGRPMAGEVGNSISGQEIIFKRGSEINVAGLLDVLVPITENQVFIDPAKKNELRDSPIYRIGFLNGATIYLDPRKSGVREDGVAWIGSPLVDAKAYYQLVAVGADRLMTKGGTVRIGTATVQPTSGTPNSSIIVRDGAVIDISGGSVRYEGGMVRTTQLVDNLGNVVDISEANPNATYVAIANGFTRSSPRWGRTETWSNPFARLKGYYVGEYDEGRDAGVLALEASSLAFDGKLFAQAYAGIRQITDGVTGTGSTSIIGDERRVQGSNSELPSGGALIVRVGSDIAVTDVVPPLAEDGTYGAWTGGSITTDGTYVRPTLSGDPPLPAERLAAVLLSDDLLSGSGLSQVTLSARPETKSTFGNVSAFTLGKVTVGADANITLNPGGIFRAEGYRIEVNGNVTVPSGKIALKTSMRSNPSGPLRDAALGDHDIVVNGNLNVAGRWVNDYQATSETMLGGAWLNGGTIEMEAAANITKLTDLYNPFNPNGPTTRITQDWVQGVGFLRDQQTGEVTQYPADSWVKSAAAKAEDISGRILINQGASLDLSSGGRVGVDGKLDLTAKGGNLTLKSNTRYYNPSSGTSFRTVWIGTEAGGIAINPERINARVTFDPSSIKAHGFGGGGTFTLVTPEFSLGEGSADVGTRLPFDFFSKAGFASYDITSNKTEFRPTKFASYGGFDAYGAVQTITVNAGQTLSLVQSVLPNIMSEAQADALRALGTGGDVNTIVSASVPTDAYDQKAVNLRLGGMLELHVAEGGKVVGAAGSSLTVGGLLNEGTIRIAGGKILRDSTSPFVTGTNELGPTGNWNDPIGFRDLSEIFTVGADGLADPAAASKIRDQNGNLVLNTDVVGDFYFSGSSSNPLTARQLFKLGVLDQDQGILLTAGSVTDLSGAVILNPRARAAGGPIRDGRIFGGGILGTVATTLINGQYHSGGRFTAEHGAVIDLSGVEDTFDRPTGSGNNLLGTSAFVRTPVWSDGGTLVVSEGGTFKGATIRAHGGNAMAQGGTLDYTDPIFAQHDPAAPTRNIVSADMIQEAGFDTLIARGSFTSAGDANIKLDRAFFLVPKPWKYGSSSVQDPQNLIAPTIRAGGALKIDAPYIGLQNVVDVTGPANGGTPGNGSVTFSGRQIDLTGAIRFDKSVANVALEATGDIRFIGVNPTAWLSFQTGSATFIDPNIPPTLKGMLSVQGDLSLVAAQIYPTTGTSFDVTSAAADGTITIGRSGSTTPPVPYSAGGNLAIQAAHIVQGGVIRVPFGTLTLGGNSAKTAAAFPVAPATKTVVLADGSITSVSAGGLSIPYGTTTDTIEWYFAPTGLEARSGPPVKVLSLNGDDITLSRGATVDLTGGGDVYAYEFVPGTGGSRDVLSRFNADQYSSNDYANGVGYQYPDRRQVYAIVPGLSDAPVAAYDPIYSADYGDLNAVSGAGRRVYLSGGNGLNAGWYTLLPAQYAMLPGGMRVVEQTDVKDAIPGRSYRQPDGTLLVSGTYGDALSGATQSTVRQFAVQSQEVIRSYSNIVLTSGNDFTYKQAAAKALVPPRTGLDAGRLVLNPLSAMRIDTVIQSAAAEGGRGSQVDVAGSRMEIVSVAGAPVAGVVQLTAGSLNNLNAESLLIGATRIDNGDGTTNLNITANSIVVANDAAHPLIAPEIVLAVDDMAFDAQGRVSPVASSLVLNDGATLIATGILSDQRSGAYVVDGRVILDQPVGSNPRFLMPPNTGIGALFRVANGPQRVVQRLRSAAVPDLPGNTASPSGPDATLTVGNVNVTGGTIGLDTSHNVTIGSAAKLRGSDIALGVTRLAFTSHAAAAGTVVITPELQAILAQGDRLTLRSQTSIGFDDGSYSFKAVAFNAATLESLEGGSVTIGGKRVEFGNSGAAGTAVDGSGTLRVDADEIVIGSGTVATVGFGNGVSLTARNGLFSGGKEGVLDIGAAALAIVAPYIGDRGAPGVFTNAPTTMSLKTTGNVAISNAGTTPIDLARTPGAPGSSLSIFGNNVSVAGTHLRATAGALTVKANGAIVLSGGALLEAPGYEQTFGDAADPQTKSAPGGTLTLAALGTGGISLGNARLSVGNGKGNSGMLKLASQNGVLDWGTASLDGRGSANGQGGTFSIETGGSIDLVGLNNRVGADGFTAGFNVRTRTGDIVLGAGQSLVSGSVNLTADGGSVIVGGTIDTSGVNGGDVALYGARGVNLQGTALLDAHANGYAADDTRQARAGNVTLGTDFVPGSSTIGNDGVVSGTSGVITVAAGARIDVSAKRPGDRLVRLMRNGVANYTYVQGDEGGTLAFRAPVVGNGSGADTLQTFVASAQSVVGAKTVDLVGFRRWDLEKVATSGLYKGVKYDAATNTVTLDVAEDLDKARPDGTLESVGGKNFLGDEGSGTIADFVQKYDVSAAYANLGGLAERANFHSRPGIDLAHTGNIVLKSNWNLGAGRVNLLAAQAAGYMKRVPEFVVPGLDTSGYVVKLGFEDEIFENLTKFTYRTNNGDVRGEAPVLNLRAGGDLDLNGSLTDGFFAFRDQTDLSYRLRYGTSASGTNWNNYILTLNGGLAGNNGQTPLGEWAAWNGTGNLNNYLGLSVASRTAAYLSASSDLSIPYTAVGNSPAARGTFVADSIGNVDGGGDPLSSAEVFPLFADGTAAQSASYVLVAGAANLANGSALSVSADPARINAASSASITVAGTSFYQVPAGSSMVGIKTDGVTVDDNISYGPTARPGAANSSPTSMADWLAQITAPGSRAVSDTSIAVLNIGRITPNVPDDDPNRALIVQLFQAFVAEKGLVLNSTDPNIGWRRNSLTATDTDMTFIAMSVKNFKAFVTEKLIPALPQIEANIEAAQVRTPAALPDPSAARPLGAKIMVRPQIRTGTGSIAMSAAGNVDLTGGAPILVNNQQVGGVAVYTAGQRVAPFTKTLTDPVTGTAVTVSTPAAPSRSNLVELGPFRYGSSIPADPVYLTGGGDITVTVQGSVLSRRDMALSNALGLTPPVWSGAAAIGRSNSGDEAGESSQPWRVINMNSLGQLDAAINPQLFQEGLGALGGGSITIDAGGMVSDLTIVAETSLRSAVALPQGQAPTNVLLKWGGGDVAVRAVGDILASRVDVASGTLRLSAGGRIGNAAPLVVGSESNFRYFDLDGVIWQPATPIRNNNETRIRIDDAVVDLEAGGDLSIAGITQLDGFYTESSALNLLAGGSVTITNTMQVGEGSGRAGPGNAAYAIYPGTLTIASLTGDVNLRTIAAPVGTAYYNGDPRDAPESHNASAPNSILMVPDPDGQLSILAAGDIGPTKIAMLDMDPYYLPGVFTLGGNAITENGPFGTTFPNSGYQWGSVGFPSVKSNMSDSDRKRQHASTPVHANDKTPVYVYAGRDIGNSNLGMTLSLPKQARIEAGRDIVNMVFTGQNLAKDDITRITAGRDIVGTAALVAVDGPANPTLRGNTFLLGGPGDFMIEAGRNMGPFLNSADVYDPRSFSNNPPLLRYAGGIVTIGNDWNPYLKPESANITAQFGVGKGADYDALREAYVKPGTEANALGGYGTKLVSWMKEHAAATLEAEFGKTDVSAEQAYAAFLKLPELRQRIFLVDVVYFDELRAPSEPNGPSYLKYSRGYTAVNMLFPAALGYTANGLEGGAKSDGIVHTGDMDLRLAAIETMFGGNINILGPGGRVLAGSVVATAQQAARRNFAGYDLYGLDFLPPRVQGTVAIPPGYEGVITQRGGHINTFTDGDFLLNQSRLFAVDGGDITMWSSNADLNAGQGAKTTPNFPPVVVRIDENLVIKEDPTGATTGAGIAAFPPKDKKKRPPNVYLLAPRGTVDAGDAGVRTPGDLNVAALLIANADNFKVGGVATGLPTIAVPNVGGMTEASNATAAVADQTKPDQNKANEQPSVIIVEVLGFGGGDGGEEDERKRKKN